LKLSFTTRTSYRFAFVLADSPDLHRVVWFDFCGQVVSLSPRRTAVFVNQTEKKFVLGDDVFVGEVFAFPPARCFFASEMHFLPLFV